MVGEKDPSVAQRVARASAQDAGTAPADTISAGCGLVRAGVFFDGTGNSRDHVPVAGVTWHTNIDILEENYIEQQSAVTEVNGQPRETSYFSIYMRGIGINASGETENDWLTLHPPPRPLRELGESGRHYRPSAGLVFLPGPRGMGWGTGPEGVESRVNEAYELLENRIRSQMPGTQPCDIWFDVFGFSRGAVAARDFANGIKGREFTYGESQVRTKFLGIFDTVSSMGEGGHTGNHGNVSLNTSGNVAEKIVHITAKDEIRQYFPLTLAMTGERIEMVGAHSDVGGGYLPEKYESKFNFLPMTYPGIQEYFESRWHEPPTYLRPNSQLDPDGDYLIVPSGEIRPNSELSLWTTTEPGLQFVSLRIMHDRALDAGVPFNEKLADANGSRAYSIPEDLDNYYQALTQGDTDSAEAMEVSIRRKYVHVSFNHETSYGMPSNLPEPRGVRRVARL